MAPFFKSDPQRALRRDIDAAKANLSRLAAKLAQSETAIAGHMYGAKKLAVDGDDSGLDEAEALLRAAEVRKSTLQAAIREVEQRLAALEQTHAENAEKKLREEVAAEVEALAREVIADATAFAVAAARLADSSARAIPTVFEANGLHNLAAVCLAETPVASDLIAKLLRAHGTAVLRGDAPAVLRKPDPTYVEAVAEKAETQILFALRSVKWHDAEGIQQLGAKCSDIYLPPQLVARALASGACVRIDDPLRKQHKGWSTEIPRLDTATDLDEAPEPEHAVEPVFHSAFEEPAVGQPRILKIAR